MLSIRRMPIRHMATLGFGLVLASCAGRSQPEVAGGSGDSSAPAAISGTGGTGSGEPGSDAGGAGGAPAITAPVYLGDEDRQGDAPVIPLPVTASFYWRGSSNGTNATWHLGNWFLTTDRLQDAHSRQLEQARDGGVWARGVSGQGRLGGAVLWVQLDHPQNRAVGVEPCSAVSFWARLDGASELVRVALNDGTRPSGVLDGGPSLPSREVLVGAEWQLVTVPFESLPFHGPALASIEFFVGQDGQSYDLWIDDLALICRISRN